MDQLSQVKMVGASFVPATYAPSATTTYTPNCDQENIVTIPALTAAITIANPTGTPINGQILTFQISQNATGGWAITWGAIYAFGTDVTAAMIPTTASAKYQISFQYHSGDAKWRCVGIARGF